jgi:hypothetical protein
MTINGSLLLACLQSGTSIKERGNRASIGASDGEIVLVFRTDTDLLRKNLGIAKVCDAAFFYMQYGERPILFFVELKGKNVREAAEQIVSTMKALGGLLRTVGGGDFPKPGDMRAVVVRSGAAPQDQSKIQDMFWKKTSVTLYFARENADLRRFI